MIILPTSSTADNSLMHFFSAYSQLSNAVLSGNLSLSQSQIESRLNSAYQCDLSAWIHSLHNRHIKVHIHQWFSRRIHFGTFTLSLRFCRVRFPKHSTTQRVLPGTFFPFSPIPAADITLLLRQGVKFMPTGLSNNLISLLYPHEADSLHSHLLKLLSRNSWLVKLMNSNFFSLSDLRLFSRFRRYYYGKKKLWVIVYNPFQIAPAIDFFFPSISYHRN